MKKYYRYQCDLKGQESTQFLELNREFYCLRSICVELSGKGYSSNFVIDDWKYLLPEGSFAEALDELEPISKELFTEVWEAALLGYQERWEAVKAKYALGQVFTATIDCFYPQGVLFRIGLDFWGIASYDEILAQVGESRMYPGTGLPLALKAYDDENRWLVLQPAEG